MILKFLKLRYSGASQEDRDNCQEVRAESSQSRGMDGYAGGSPLNCPLMPAPDTPHHWLCRPASPSADVMSGPGWQESWPGGATSL